MKVVFISRDTLFTGKGGDTIQMLKTAECLKKLGVEVDIFTSSSAIDYSKYDIIHGFNIIRPADLLKHFGKFKGTKVLSTIYVNYFEYESNARGGLIGFVFNFFGNNFTEYVKTVARWLVNGEKNFSIKYLLLGHKRSVKYLIKISDVLLPNSKSEYERLAKDYGINKNFEVIPNAIDKGIFGSNLNIGNKQDNLVISVAKIDGRKNQLNLIRALNNTHFELIIIGKPAPNHLKFYTQCKNEAAKNVRFVEEVEQKELIKYYLAAKVHAMPSWFETTGLSSLEAIAMGCNIVITDKGDTEEYFGNNAFYCKPDDIKSIYEAVCLASQKKVDEEYRKKVYSEYIWEKTAEKTLAAYRNYFNNQFR